MRQRSTRTTVQETASYPRRVLACRVLGHRYRFRAEGATMIWQCERCGDRRTKTYPSAADAARFARAFDREDRHELGRRAPLIGLLPLRIHRAWRDYRAARK
jgi:ribosomal protein L37AE/L43A